MNEQEQKPEITFGFTEDPPRFAPTHLVTDAEIRRIVKHLKRLLNDGKAPK